ncbi:uncharacterized protein LOC100937188 isoform X1 [Pongo abelii]|uniref:uncharacterized protein LOC100937188 isoform X1 n=1 Tax=Pongo abelii TaxID=9601 RepID=UPI0030044BA1
MAPCQSAHWPRLQPSGWVLISVRPFGLGATQQPHSAQAPAAQIVPADSLSGRAALGVLSLHGPSLVLSLELPDAGAASSLGPPTMPIQVLKGLTITRIPPDSLLFPA